MAEENKIVLKGCSLRLPYGIKTGEVSDGYHTFDELYAHRIRLFSTLMHAYPHLSWWSRKQFDGQEFKGWVFSRHHDPIRGNYVPPAGVRGPQFTGRY